MASKARKVGWGICRLCGEFRELSYEHVPPQKAYNDQTAFRMKVENYYLLEPGERPQRAYEDLKQGGWGYMTLCEPCNNWTGGVYAPSFIDWSRQGMVYYEKTDGHPSRIDLNRMRPLSILKQIVTMFLSVNEGMLLYRANKDLTSFVLNKHRRNLPGRFQIYTYFQAPGPSREAPICGVMDTINGGSVVVTEFSYPPFGYLMTIASPPPDVRLFNITHFGTYFYEEEKSLELSLPVLPTHGPMAGDYRKFRDFPWNRKHPRVFIDL